MGEKSDYGGAESQRATELDRIMKEIEVSASCSHNFAAGDKVTFTCWQPWWKRILRKLGFCKPLPITVTHVDHENSILTVDSK